MSALWIKNPLALYAPHVLDASGGLVLQNGVIQELLPAGARPSGTVDQVFEANSHVILPGLINGHHHFYQTLTRALPAALDKELFPWLQSLYPVWAGLTPEHIQSSSRLALIELLLSGCTTASDHHYVFPAGLDQAIDLQIQAAGELGMRVVLTAGLHEPQPGGRRPAAQKRGA